MKKLAFLILIALTLTSCEQIQNTLDSAFGNKEQSDKETKPKEPSSCEKKLKLLMDEYDKGILSAAEYKKQKKEIELNCVESPPSTPPTPTPTPTPPPESKIIVEGQYATVTLNSGYMYLRPNPYKPKDRRSNKNIGDCRRLYKGERVLVIEKDRQETINGHTDNWYKVRPLKEKCNNITGYAFGQYLKTL